MVVCQSVQLDEAKKEKAARKALAKKLKAMEDKLMAGGAEQSVQDLVEQRKNRQVRVCACVCVCACVWRWCAVGFHRWLDTYRHQKDQWKGIQLPGHLPGLGLGLGSGLGLGLRLS